MIIIFNKVIVRSPFFRSRQRLKRVKARDNRPMNPLAQPPIMLAPITPNTAKTPSQAPER